jgi:hypothetical protein
VILGVRPLALVPLLALLGLPRVTAAGDAPLTRAQLVGELEIPDWQESIRLCANGRYVHYLARGMVRGSWAVEPESLVFTASEVCLLEGDELGGCFKPEAGVARAEEKGLEGVRIVPEIATAELRAMLAGAPPPGEPGLKPWTLHHTPDPKLCDPAFTPRRAGELRAPKPKGK